MMDREPLETSFVPRFVYWNGWTSLNVASDPENGGIDDSYAFYPRFILGIARSRFVNINITMCIPSFVVCYKCIVIVKEMRNSIILN